ncbi:helix-turn-helix domain-containing protein [Flavitalea antarctica]
MKRELPHNFQFHQYLQKVLGASDPSGTFFIATEKDFAKGGNIDYPYRSYFYVVALMHKGDCRLRVGVNEYDIVDKTLSVVGPGIVRSWTKNDWQAINHTIFFKPDFFDPPFANGFLQHYVFFKAGVNHAIKLLDTDYRKVSGLLELLQAYKSNKRVSQGIFFAFLELVDQIYQVIGDGVNQSTRNQKICNQFAGLLHAHYRDEKELSFYAEKMKITPKTLSDILKKETGRSAKQSIDDYIILEAKSLMKQTGMNIKEIVYWLGYEDPSYFTKLFKNKTGITPLEYRSS